MVVYAIKGQLSDDLMKTSPWFMVQALGRLRRGASPLSCFTKRRRDTHAHRSRNGAERRSRTPQEKQAKAAPRLGHYISTTRNTGHCHAAVASRGGLTPFASANAQRPLQRTLAFCAVRPRAFHARRSGACGCVSGREGPDIETETVRHAARFRGGPVPPPRTHRKGRLAAPSSFCAFSANASRRSLRAPGRA